MQRDWRDDFGGTEDDHPVERVRNAPQDDDGDAIIRDEFGPAILGQDEAEETSFQQFIRLWMNERHAPDILPVREDLLARLLDHARKQVGSRACLRCTLLLRAEIQAFST